ncbi:MAG: cytochrome P450 [Pseudomonadota bacterium]
MTMKPPKLTLDLASPDFHRDPVPTLARLYEAGGVVETRVPILGRLVLVGSHEATRTVLKAPETFSVSRRRRGADGGSEAAAMPWWMPKRLRLLADNMLTKDGPEHRRLRRLADGPFRRAVVLGYRDAVARLAAPMIERTLAPGGDAVRDLARPLPLAVICEILALPEADRPRITRLLARMSNSGSPWGLIRALPAIGALSQYLRKEIRRRRQNPGEDLISALAIAEDEEGEPPLSEDELLAMFFTLFVAGHETTIHLISGALAVLPTQPEARAALAADLSLSNAAAVELLRQVSPVQVTKPRAVTSDAEIGGIALPAGSMVLPVLIAANRDPSVFTEPERLDWHRSPNPHLGFGTGPHLCLGLHLALLEMEVVLEGVLSRAPEYRVARATGDLAYARRLGLRALKSLPLTT